MDGSSIEWTDATWNPVRGSSRCSPGCGGGTPDSAKGGCYAERQAIRHAYPGGPYEGLVVSTTAGPRWTGAVRAVPEFLEQPLRWTRPRRIFVNSMSDLFHETLPEETIAGIFSIMARAQRHTFQVLTKRAERMSDLLMSTSFRRSVKEAPTWPLPNVWMGVSAERQKELDERGALLLRTPAALRFISAEPLLEEVEVGAHTASERLTRAQRHLRRASYPLGGQAEGRRLDWVIVGGESGTDSRFCDVSWFRRIVGTCREDGVPVFVKQLGARPRSGRGAAGAEADAVGRHWRWDEDPQSARNDGYLITHRMRHPKGGDPLEWPEDLRVREYPGRAA